MHVCEGVHPSFLGVFACVYFVVACAKESHVQMLSRSDSAVGPAAS